MKVSDISLDFCELFGIELNIECIVGPWSPLSYAFLMFAIGLIVYQSHEAINIMPVFNPKPEYDEGDGWWRFVLFLYGVGIIYYVIKNVGWWPMYSFTMMSWSLFTFRYLFSSLYHLDLGISYFYILSEALRFPALVCNSITVSIWWTILVPSISFFIRHQMGPSKLKAFMKWNFSPTLINIHLLNLPLCAIDHYLHPRQLTTFDLWMSLIIAIAYVLFYLFYMDPLGLHFYHIILSPRPHWCFIPYTLTLSLFPLFQWLWNQSIV